jgi:aminoglycoside 2''-phosphotransferase
MYERSATIFEGLNELPWADLRHAYGSAEEVPMWLRQLTSQDQALRESAYDALEASICHQGWICPATGYTVPFLIELLSNPQIQDKAHILELLAYIAAADPLDEETWRNNPGVPVWDVSRDIPFKDAHAEVALGTPVYISLLDDVQPHVRMQAAHVLANMRQSDVTLRDLLLAHMRTESNERVRANLVLALAKLSLAQGQNESVLLRELLHEDTTPLARFCAALELAESEHDATSQVALDILAEALQHNPESLLPYRELALGGAKPQAAARWALYNLGPERLTFLIPWLEEAIAATPPTDFWGFVAGLNAELLLFIVFRERPQTLQSERAANTLTDEQIQALNHLLASSRLWRNGNFSSLLRTYGLPAKREEIATYLGRTLPPDTTAAQAKSTHPDAATAYSNRLRAYSRYIVELFPELPIQMMRGKGVSSLPDELETDEFTLRNKELRFRFPRREDAVEALKREVQLLRTIRERLSLPVPDPAYSNIDTSEIGHAFMGYRMFPGKPLVKEMLESVPGEVVNTAIAHALGSFLQALHTTPLTDLEKLHLPTVQSRQWSAALIEWAHKELLPRIQESNRESIQNFLASYENDPDILQFTSALVHGSFRPEVIIYDAHTHAISGIVGFTHAGIGDPAYDLAGIFGSRGYGKLFIERMAEKYPAILGMWRRAAFYASMRSMTEVLSRQKRGPRYGFTTFFPSPKPQQ